MVKKKKKNSKNDLPYWAVPLLQGLAFWLGYKRQYCGNYVLTEGAVIGEAVSLFLSILKKDDKLEYEKMYKEMIESDSTNIRADIVITNNNNVKYIIEFKRFFRTRINSKVKKYENYKRIEEDFEKLINVKNSNNKIRCFLILGSQGLRPNKIVTENGNAKKYQFSDKTYVTHTLRVCKASKSFRVKNNAHYACLIEVLKNKIK